VTRGITVAVLDGNAMIVGVPGDVSPDKARMLQMVVAETFPEWKPLVIANGTVVDLRSTAEPELAAKAESLIVQLQDLIDSQPDVFEPGNLKPIG
jgi:hypothetical protein